jgi:hypothetical protein
MIATHVDPNARLRLADHMRACVVDDQVVLLDLERSRYFALKGRHSRIVRQALDASDSTTPAFGIEESSLVEPLLRKRILTTAPPQRTECARPLEAAASSPEWQEQVRGANIQLRDLSRFLFAVSLAALWLRRRSLDSIAASVHDLHRPAGGVAEQGVRLQRAITVFDRLRPLVFTSRDKCLFDSLALAVFLRRQGLTASWVIGVSIRPFTAHSWIQDRSEVLNDVPENVRRFTPILVV